MSFNLHFCCYVIYVTVIHKLILNKKKTRVSKNEIFICIADNALSEFAVDNTNLSQFPECY